MEEKTDNNNPKTAAKKKIAITLFAVIVAVGAFIAVSYMRYTASHITTDDAFVEGTIYAVSSKVPATVKAVYVKETSLLNRETCLSNLTLKTMP